MPGGINLNVSGTWSRNWILRLSRPFSGPGACKHYSHRLSWESGKCNPAVMYAILIVVVVQELASDRSRAVIDFTSLRYTSTRDGLDKRSKTQDWVFGIKQKRHHIRTMEPHFFSQYRSFIGVGLVLPLSSTTFSFGLGAEGKHDVDRWLTTLMYGVSRFPIFSNVISRKATDKVLCISSGTLHSRKNCTARYSERVPLSMLSKYLTWSREECPAFFISWAALTAKKLLCGQTWTKTEFLPLFEQHVRHDQHQDVFSAAWRPKERDHNSETSWRWALGGSRSMGKCPGPSERRDLVQDVSTLYTKHFLHM